MDRTEIAAAVSLFLAEECGLAPNDVQADTPLFTGGLLESLDVVRLVLFLEQRFQLRLSPLEVSVERFDSLDRIVDYISSR